MQPRSSGDSPTLYRPNTARSKARGRSRAGTRRLAEAIAGRTVIDAGIARQPQRQPRTRRPPGPEQGKRALCPLSRLRRESLTTLPQPRKPSESGQVPRAERANTIRAGRPQQRAKSTRGERADEGSRVRNDGIHIAAENAGRRESSTGRCQERLTAKPAVAVRVVAMRS